MTERPEPEHETRYRCPKCKREVTTLIPVDAVTCSRCGRSMRSVEQP